MGSQPIASILDYHRLAEERAAQLGQELAENDESYRGYRERMLAAIAALREPFGKKPNAQRADQRAQPGKPDEAPDRLEAVDEAVAALPVRFNTSEVRRFVIEKYPVLAPTLKGNYIASRLDFLARKGKIKKIKSGQNGEPSEWQKL
jgi:hypothetical protein